MRNTRGEYFASDIPSITDIERTSQKVRVVPLGDISGASVGVQKAAPAEAVLHHLRLPLIFPSPRCRT
jgi:hypothetical protein